MNPADIWTKSAQTLLKCKFSIPWPFESITRVMIPPTPVTPEDYISAGLPLFKEYLEVESKGRAGPQGFTNFTTVQELDVVMQIC